MKHHSFCSRPDSDISEQGRFQMGQLGRSPPVKSTEVILFNMILCNSENSIQDCWRCFVKPFCCPFFFVTAVLWSKYASSLLQ